VINYSNLILVMKSLI